MLCSARELGLSDDHTGILEIDGVEETGVPVSRVLDREDTMIEIDLTPNRPDCASVLGIAREIAGSAGRELVKPVERASLPKLRESHPDFKVEIREPELCPRYAARRLINVKPGPSPLWLRQRLQAVGVRPINNIVDITNYVMLELGQPLHAFDFKRLAGSSVIVRRPGPNETAFTTLDGTERTLEPEMLMICDNEQPVAVAGVMGGLNSEVTEATTEVLLESACFDPVSIRRTARRLNISSEASYRFERGVDPGGAVAALERAAFLMVEHAGAELVDGGIDLYPGRQEELVIPLRVQRVCELLGLELSAAEIADYLRRIEFKVNMEDEKLLQVTVPTFRVDVEREVDFVEEIARLVGYNDIPTTSPLITMDYPARDPLRGLCRRISEIMVARGFAEAINYSFTSEKFFDQLGLAPEDARRKVTRLLNPLTEDQAVMRSMLLPGLLENVRHNCNHQNTDIALFEIGKIFLQHQTGGQPEERLQLCALMSGSRYPGSVPLYFSGQESDVFDLKGIAELLIESLALQATSGEISCQPAASPARLPYAVAGAVMNILNGAEVIGSVGVLSRDVLKKFGIKQDVFFLEMDVTAMNDLPRKEKTFQPLPRFPSVLRDIALVVPVTVGAGELLQAVRDLNMDTVERVELFDVYQGKPIEDGMKSVALSVTYRSAEKTLDDETVDIFHEKIVNTLMSRFQGRYRE